MKVSLVIPALNEIESIANTLKEVPKDAVDEIIVADGHSTDGTPELVRKLGFTAIEQEAKGFGLGIMSGIKQATGDVIVIMDADGSHNPADIPSLIAKVKQGCDIGWGSRYLPQGGSEDDTLIRYIGNKGFTFLSRFLHKIPVTDILYLFAAFRKEIFKELSFECPGFEFCIELPIKAYKAGFKFGEVPCRERKRYGSVSKVNAFKDGWKILRAILRY